MGLPIPNSLLSAVSDASSQQVCLSCPAKMPAGFANPFVLEQEVLRGLPSAAYGAQRAAEAYIWSPNSAKKSKDRTVAVVFAHGFSQGPLNYQSLFDKFTDKGWYVIAPTTTFDKLLFPWDRVETTGLFAKLPEKLQVSSQLSAQSECATGCRM